MKKVVTIIACLFALGVSNKAKAQRIGFEGGLNQSNVILSIDDEELYKSTLNKSGVRFGLNYDHSITDLFGLETGVYFSQKGLLAEEVTEIGFFGSAKTTMDLTLNYLEIPILGVLSKDFGKFKAFLKAGPYIGAGLTGKYKMESEYLGMIESEEEKVKWDEDDFKRLDYGLLFGTGLEYNSFSLGCSYGLGLANFSQYSEEGDVIKNRTLNVSLGYKLGL